MKIKCYGSRGSIPVSGKEYIKYGGDTCCITICSKKGELLVIDAGTGIRKLGNELIKDSQHEFSMIFTHAHWDHLMGFPFFKPIYDSRFTINLYGCPFVPNMTVKDMVGSTMHTPNFPVDVDDCQAIINYNEIKYSAFNLGSLKIIPIFLSHPNGGVGYKIIEDNKSFVFLTDNELAFRHPDGLDFIDYVRDCKDVDLLIHDAEYLPEEYPRRKKWGHSTYEDVAKLAIGSNVKQLGLFHHNQDRTDDEIDKIVDSCQMLLNKSHKTTQCIAITSGQEIIL